jgi:hypothetical protein
MDYILISTRNTKVFRWYLETKDRHLAWLFGLELNTK